MYTVLFRSALHSLDEGDEQHQALLSSAADDDSDTGSPDDRTTPVWTVDEAIDRVGFGKYQIVIWCK